MKRRRKTSGFDRKAQYRELRRRHYIFCEGKTEEQFLKAFLHHHRLSSVSVVTVGQVGEPKRVVGDATTKRDELRKNRKEKEGKDWLVHVVFDRDRHEHFDTACNDATQRNMVLGISVPCFEIFLVWLHEDQYSALDHKKAQGECKRLNPGYCHETNPIIDFAKIADKVADAMKRAAHRRAQMLEDDKFVNPSSQFDLVLSAILDPD